MPDGSYQLWFAVRYIHVASVALLAGGAFIIFGLSVAPLSTPDPRTALHAAYVYEWMFWSLVGITAATGISNLGLKGEGLLGAETSWGSALTVKLIAVVTLLSLSAARTDVVIRSGGANQTTERCRPVLGLLYGATVAIVLGTLWLGLGLAHGRY